MKRFYLRLDKRVNDLVYVVFQGPMVAKSNQDAIRLAIEFRDALEITNVELRTERGREIHPGLGW